MISSCLQDWRQFPISLLKEITCRWCALIFHVCRSCWRGQAYCSSACRYHGRRSSLNKAQQRYRQTDRGKEAHRLSERRRRMGRTMKREKKSMDDQGSTMVGNRVKEGMEVIFKGVRCLFCGSDGPVMVQFPRRGYGVRGQ